MADENSGGEAKSLEEANKVIGGLKEQIDNLNKGIATYRDEAGNAKKDAVSALETANSALAKVEEFKDLLEKKDDGVQLTPDEEKKFEAFAKKNNLVSKKDLDTIQNASALESIKAVENQAVAEFLEKHPEYDDDEKWKEVTVQFALYKQPTNITAYRALLNRIHKDLHPESSKDAEAKARAAIIQRQKLGLGGGTGKTGKEDGEAEVEEMMKKYPNLSREQIETQLAGIRALPKREPRK